MFQLTEERAVRKNEGDERYVFSSVRSDLFVECGWRMTPLAPLGAACSVRRKIVAEMFSMSTSLLNDRTLLTELTEFWFFVSTNRPPVSGLEPNNECFSSLKSGLFGRMKATNGTFSAPLGATCL